MDGNKEISEPRKKIRRSRRRKKKPYASVIAALDLGTNNCRLLIARPNQGSFRVIDGYSKDVRLGEGLVFSGALSVDAMERTISALKICQQKIIKRGVKKGRYVATEACRKASNGEEFLERVQKEIGIRLEIISSREEASLTLKGCLPLLEEASTKYGLTFDVGGGSAEIMLVRLDRKRPFVEGWVSLPYGVVTLTERFKASNISKENYRFMVEEISSTLREFDIKYKIQQKISDGIVQVLGTAGTVTTIAGIHLGLTKYNRALVDGLWLDSHVIMKISDKLVRSSFEERASLACVGESRAELVVAGCGVLEAIFKVWPAERIRVADRGVREGLLLALALKKSRGKNYGIACNE